MDALLFPDFKNLQGKEVLSLAEGVLNANCLNDNLSAVSRLIATSASK